MIEVVLVTGASGVLGGAVMRQLALRGLPRRGFGRRNAAVDAGWDCVRGDLLTGEGLTAALAGVSVVVHCATNPSSPSEDLACIDRLIAAARFAGGPRIVFAGIAGTEDAARGFPYYAVKLGAERRLRQSDLPNCIVRATQFHPFVAYILTRLDAGLAVIAPPGCGCTRFRSILWPKVWLITWIRERLAGWPIFTVPRLSTSLDWPVYGCLSANAMPGCYA